MFGTIARKKHSLNNLMDTVLKVCKKEIVPNPNLVEYPEDASANTIVSSIMKRAEAICNKVCTFEKTDNAR